MSQKRKKKKKKSNKKKQQRSIVANKQQKNSQVVSNKKKTATPKIAPNTEPEKIPVAEAPVETTSSDEPLTSALRLDQAVEIDTTASTRKSRFSWRTIASLFILPVSMAAVELIAHFLLFGDEPFGLVIGISFGIGLLVSALLLLFGRIAHYIGGAIISLATTVYVIAMFIYFQCLHMYFTWEMIFMVDQVGQFNANIKVGISENIDNIILLFIPLIAYLVLGFLCMHKRKTTAPKNASAADGREAAQPKTTFASRFPAVIAGLVLAAMVLGGSFAAASSDEDANAAAKGMLYNSNLAYSTYGFLGGTAINVHGMLYGYGSDDTTYRGEGTLPGVAYNSLSIDWDEVIANEKNKTIKDMHEYFSSLTPSEKNQYTGMFEGKNLIFLTLEGFSYKCIDPELTPTLYKMYTEGFRFNNFYDTTWSGSTASGEYSNMTGSFYTSAACLRMSAKTYTYSALGNMFASAGYTNYAYHNNNYQYYDRDLSHPNFGYKWEAVDNGLPAMENVWPRSDLELAKITEAEYMDSDSPWHAYYMTVSGHAEYSFAGNTMSARHKKDLPAKYDDYSSDVRAYLACQLEVELMLEELVSALEERGELENTVFAMCCDHYPYALSNSELAELYGLKTKGVLSNPEMYRNAFILWSADMEEPVEIDKVCNSYDIAPTLYNLFGIDYESRIIIGRDILSSVETPSIINCNAGAYWNWMTNEGYYDAAKAKFTPNENADLGGLSSEEYADKINSQVNAMRKYSLAILDNDYYKYLKKYLKTES